MCDVLVCMVRDVRVCMRDVRACMRATLEFVVCVLILVLANDSLTA